MFAYCNNNAICYSDTSGQRMVSAMRGEMAGGRPDIVATSDSQEESNLLLDELCKQLSDMSQFGTVCINVRYIGTYYIPRENTLGKWLLDAGLFVAGELLPAVTLVCPTAAPIVGPISLGLKATSGYLLAKNLGETLHPGLPGGKDYDQYKVTVSWYEEHNYLGGNEVVFNQYVFYYLRDDRKTHALQWYLQSVIPIYP